MTEALPGIETFFFVPSFGIREVAPLIVGRVLERRIPLSGTSAFVELVNDARGDGVGRGLSEWLEAFFITFTGVTLAFLPFDSGGRSN